MPTSSSIFVTGGTGFLGSYLLRFLVKKGYKNIKALKRPNSPMDLVQDIEHQIQWIEGDLLDIFLLEDIIEDCDQVYHTAAMVSYHSKDADEMKQINEGGTAGLVNACLHCGIEKLLHVSSISAIGKKKNQKTVNEQNKWQRSANTSNYAISKYLSEQEVWRGVAEGLNTIIINPSVILGSGFWNRGTSIFFQQVWKGLNFYPIGGTGFVDVRDVAQLMILMMESPVTNQRFIANGENLSYHSLFNEIAQSLQRKPPGIKVSPLLTEIAWRAAFLGSKITGNQAVITKETAKMTALTYFYENEKSKDIFDFQYTPISQTIQETALQFREAQQNGAHPKYLDI